MSVVTSSFEGTYRFYGSQDASGDLVSYISASMGIVPSEVILTSWGDLKSTP